MYYFINEGKQLMAKKKVTEEFERKAKKITAKQKPASKKKKAAKKEPYIGGGSFCSTMTRNRRTPGGESW